MKVSNGISATDYLFSPDYIFRNLKHKRAIGYVNDYFTDEMIEEWSNTPEQPVLISAQTGSGKNYFVTHRLREYAKRKERRILYVSNRVALDYQQKQELAKLTRTQIPSNTAIGSWENTEQFSNVTVTTYHKLSNYFSERPVSWFQQFSYIVLDECHFFYSDAYFNAHTGYILERITQEFSKQVRIYMSATFEDIVDPICYYESGKMLYMPADMHEKYYNCTPVYYYFPRDFSNYHCCYFSKIEQIRDEIQKSPKKEKWIVFVTSKREGDKLRNLLNGTESQNNKLISPVALYIDSASRNSEDYNSRQTWEQIKLNGKFDAQVLVTTSVLDNGFSIKDPKIKNIVLCTSDKTEFIQELGRCRVERDKKINIYVKKMGNMEQARRKKLYEDYNNLFLDFCGEVNAPGSWSKNKFTEKGDPVRVIQKLWNTNEDFRRKLIYLVPENGGTLVPYINNMARWRTCQLEREIKRYEALFNKHNTLAEIIYKSLWLESDPDSYVVNPQMLLEKDLDRRALTEAEQALLEFLKEQAEEEKILYEEEKAFKEFADRFLQLYKKAFPDDVSVRRGGARTWKNKAIQSHLERASTQTDGRISFSLAKASESGNAGWLLRKSEN